MKKLLTLLFTAVLATVANAQTFESGLYKYTFSDGNVYVYGLSAYGKTQSNLALTIPTTVTCNGVNYNVYGIFNNAFANTTNINSVYIPAGIKKISREAFRNSSVKTANIYADSIGLYAFKDCASLWQVILNEGVKVMNFDAFPGTNIGTLSIPASMTSFEKSGSLSCFPNMPTLTDIYVYNANPSFASYNGALYSKDFTKLVRMPEGKTACELHPNTETIGDYAYRGCNINRIVLNYGVSTVAYCAFYYCKATEIVLPATVTRFSSVNNCKFEGCTSLQKLYVNARIAPEITVSDNFQGVTVSNVELYVPYGMESAYRNAGWTGFKCYNADFNTSFDILASGYKCDGTANGSSDTFCFTVTQESNVTHLGRQYDGCVKIVRHGNQDRWTANIPDYVKCGDKEFMVNEIGEYAFANQPRLANVFLPPHLRYIDDYAFKDSPVKGTLPLPNGINTVANYAFMNTKITRLIIPSSTSMVRSNAFYQMTSLTDLVLNANIFYFLAPATIYNYNLDGVPSDCRILVPTNRVNSFKNSDNWRSRANYIQAGAFDFVYTHYSIDQTPNALFDDDRTNARITITSNNPVVGPDGNTYDGTCKYVYHPSIESENLRVFTFMYYNDDRTWGGRRKYLVTAIDDSCFAGSHFTNFNNNTFYEPVKTLGRRCFYNSAISGDITIPSTVTSIGEGAFLSCKSLTSLRFGDVVPPFDTQIFGDNNTNFECYVPLTRLKSYLDLSTNWTSYDTYLNRPESRRFAPYFTAEADTRMFSCPAMVRLDESLMKAYATYQYDANTATVKLVKESSPIPGYQGVLLTDLTRGQEYIMHQDLQFIGWGGNYFMYVTDPVDLRNESVGLYWDAENKYFVRPTSTHVEPAGSAYLKISASELGNGVNKVYTDLFGGQPAYKTGDVDGNGNVDGNDLNLLINILLGKDQASNYGDRANVDGNGNVDGNDLNTLINILLGK